MAIFPARYEVIDLLGRGGGGEVWSVRDRLTGASHAFKSLAADASEHEVLALVREASTLSGLEGLGLPLVVGFGMLEDGRRYLVRDLVVGESFEAFVTKASRAGGEPLRCLSALVDVADQLTLLHRAGTLHGDIKPGNIIVAERGGNLRGQIVDLGLAAPLVQGGATAKGLTPDYAAPELLEGGRLTLRTEVYALGKTIEFALLRGATDDLPPLTRPQGGAQVPAKRVPASASAKSEALDAATLAAVREVADVATREAAEARYPSIDELALALRNAIGRGPKSAAGLTASTAVTALTVPSKPALVLPVYGLEPLARQLTDRVLSLSAGEVLVAVGGTGSGRTTLLRRLAWNLSAAGHHTLHLEPVWLKVKPAEALSILMADHAKVPAGVAFVLVDDWQKLGADAQAKVMELRANGAKLVVVAEAGDFAKPAIFELPPLDLASARDLIMRGVPSMPTDVVTALLERTKGRPGPIRTFVTRLQGRVVTSPRDLDEVFSDSEEATLATLRHAVVRGRMGHALELLPNVTAKNDDDTVEVSVLGALVHLSQGNFKEAEGALDTSAKLAPSSRHARAFALARARISLRTGAYDAAAGGAESVARGHDDAIAAEALAVLGVALSFLGKSDEALSKLREAAKGAEAIADSRIVAIAFGSLAIGQQRTGDTDASRLSYERALRAATEADDAWTVAITRLNLGSLVRIQGELAPALEHFEAAIDMGERAGATSCVQQARFNLANLDLYLGRHGRAHEGILALARAKASLAPAARAQLLGLEAEYCDRTGDGSRAAELYEASALTYDALARSAEALEARLEALLLRAREAGADGHELSRSLEGLEPLIAQNEEHHALAALARGAVAMLRGDESAAREGFDLAVKVAREKHLGEWTWRAFEARARLAQEQGAPALARRDVAEALSVLEETASRLPKDLREVFWNDRKRAALRESSHASPALHASQASHAPQFRRGDAVEGRGSGRTPGQLVEDRLNRVLELARELARERDLPALLARITDHAMAIVGADRGFVVLCNEEGLVVAHTVRGPKGDGDHQTFSRSIAERVIASGEPVVSTSAREDSRFKEAKSVHQLAIQSIACVPIRGLSPRGETLGALYLEARLRPGGHFQAELPTLSAFADQAAVAIENARLLEQNRQRAEELEQINRELTEAKGRIEELLGRRTEQLNATRRDLRQVRAELRGHFGYAGLVGTSEAMRRVYSIIDRVRDADVPVLLTGESGVGKEMVARAIHSAGARNKGPFVGVNCGAIPQNLLESELFGHVRGSFTGADRDHKGLFRQASGGTILLDEVGELPLSMQTALLRVLQEKTVRPVGGAAEEPVDVRIIAATNRDLEEMSAAGTFREDLYYRLHVVELRVPPLRERSDDVPALVDHFLSLFASRYRRERKIVSRSAARVLTQYAWPGNVRQLENVLLNAWLMSEGAEITPEDIALPTARRDEGRGAPRPTSDGRRPAPPDAPPESRTHEEFRGTERERILHALAECQWNRVQAAKIVGMPRRTFYRRLKEYGIL